MKGHLLLKHASLEDQEEISVTCLGAVDNASNDVMEISIVDLLFIRA